MMSPAAKIPGRGGPELIIDLKAPTLVCLESDAGEVELTRGADAARGKESHIGD